MTTLTGGAITLYRLLTLRSAVELEGKGLRFRRSMTAQAKRELGLSRGAPRQAVLDGLTVLIEQAGMNLKPGDIQP